MDSHRQFALRIRHGKMNTNGTQLGPSSGVASRTVTGTKPFHSFSGPPANLERYWNRNSIVVGSKTLDRRSVGRPVEGHTGEREIRTIRVLEFEERIAAYVVPCLGLARHQILPQGFAASRNIRASVEKASVTHEQPEFLWHGQRFAQY